MKFMIAVFLVAFLAVYSHASVVGLVGPAHSGVLLKGSSAAIIPGGVVTAGISPGVVGLGGGLIGHGGVLLG